MSEDASTTTQEPKIGGPVTIENFEHTEEGV